MSEEVKSSVTSKLHDLQLMADGLTERLSNIEGGDVELNSATDDAQAISNLLEEFKNLIGN